MKIFQSIFSVLGFIAKPGEHVLDKYKRLKNTGAALSVGGGSSIVYALTNPEYISELTLLIQAITTLIGVCITAYAKVKSGDFAPPTPPTLLILILVLPMIHEVQHALLAKIQTDFPNVEVDVIPEQPDQYQLTAGKAAILVMYDGLVVSEPLAQSAQVQPAGMRFSVFVVSRMNKIGGATTYSPLSLLDGLRSSLTGFVPNPSMPNEFFEYLGEGFSHQKNGVWFYEQNWNLKKLFI